MEKICNFASYNLLSLFSPPLGQEYWHCDMKRGFIKARKRDLQVKALLEQDSIPQAIGLLAQQGVYEFHHDPLMLYRKDAVEKISDILNLSQVSDIVQKRVIKVLEKYQEYPILFDKKIIQLNRGDEGFPKPILINYDNYKFNLYAAIDCIFQESDGRIHILDFKTGQSDFDRRQAYIYLLAAQYLYPNHQAIASFYNLETGVLSQVITATPNQLKAMLKQLIKLSKKHQSQLKYYWKNKQNFNKIFSPNPGLPCRYCPFNSICEFSTIEVSA
ncbi:PD-(D/E)XK nuclease family protein [Crocosphaera sp. XPORK-15E]|uniref:PD-(D/E)XK nuclease family protein n=1 Tax=Crocosphaera sp. XPORK-15E TaxID=3110247 RepID=UPI002B202F39|nr:PD-(D/E)XK nuclease family protein [Crocosphaera sp. XPORK-15E]MEA5533693.1 PD-(D/E)XK nuclease family protein [Crocosphaera sp. XPORK-15E]